MLPLSQEPTTSPGWFERPMCWAQLTLAENDPPTYDQQFWVDYFAQIHADAV